VYSKAEPTKNFVDIEQKLRAEEANVYLIALVSYRKIRLFATPKTHCLQEKQKEGFENFTFIDLQGKLDCTYVVKFFFGPKARRKNLEDRWPTTPEENLERLADAGFEYDRLIPKCTNCGGEQ
jgi:hypothetical protein